ncbi:hypothetical protein EV363DRAFT_1295574 [Boletus edulis]|nr:hypothetical protein EV363DRAFT_1295574 [Boletus edulis]
MLPPPSPPILLPLGMGLPPLPLPDPSEACGLLALMWKMQAEIDQLQVERQNLTFSHAASTPPSSLTAPTPPPSPTSSISTAHERTAYPDHFWLQGIFDHKDLPLYLCHISSQMASLYYHTIPDDMPEVLMVHPNNFPPFYLRINLNGDLAVTRNIDTSDLVTICITVDFPGSTHPLFPYVSQFHSNGNDVYCLPVPSGVQAHDIHSTR